MAGGLADISPSTWASAATAEEVAALRARLAAAEADLSQTQSALASAQTDLADQDAAAAADAVGRGGAPVGAGGGGSAAVEGIPAAPAAGAGRGTLAPSTSAPAAIGGGSALTGAGPAHEGAPPGAHVLGDYADDAEGAGGDSDDEGGWGHGRRCSGVAGPNGRSERIALSDAAAYDDGVDFYQSYTPSDWLQGFDFPRAVLRPDGTPMHFTPADPVHTTTFPGGSRDELVARHWYCSLAWTEHV